MNQNEILKHYGYLTRLALSKCGSQSDADDLVADTMLAAFAFLHGGGTIEHPKTWLANTLYHRFNSGLRKKYRSPVIVCIDTLDEAADEDEPEFLRSDEAAEVRRELNFLAYTTREVMLRYYFGKCSVARIAAQLGIPEGTVKSRLDSGRGQIKKGLEKMENRDNYIPGRLYVCWSGSDGPHNEPMSLIENDLIAQNLLILAYDKPLTIPELSRRIGIPAAYIEPVVDKLVNGELMVRTDSDRYYSDFIIYEPDDSASHFDAQLKFVDAHFDIIWNIMTELTDKIGRLEYSGTINARQLKKLERYCILRALQNFQLNAVKAEKRDIPKRRDGGSWIAMGYSSPAGYHSGKNDKAFEYTVCGGHRTTGGSCDFGGADYLQLCEFDTTLWDSPHRFWSCGYSDYFKYINNLLWCVYRSIPFGDSGISNSMIESIPKLEEVGLLSYESGKLSSESGTLAVDIPVMSREVYAKVNDCIGWACERLMNTVGGDYLDYLRGNMLPIPAHLKSVSDMYRYLPATNYIVMAAVREAYDKGLHLQGVDYCCPPVVLVYNLKG